MRPILKLLVVLAAVASMLSAPDFAAADARLDSYRASGVIAERFDGYVEIRDSGAPADARALVDEVNAKRRALYARRAQESNVPVEEVGKVFATQIVNSAPPGTYFRQQGGGYVRK